MTGKPIEIGDVIGSVTVIGRTVIPGKPAKMKCLCSCGSETDIWRTDLSNARTKKEDISCRKCSYEKRAVAKRKYHVDLVPGGKFGDWTIVGLSDERTKDGKVLYTTICACGTLGTHTSLTLRSGRATKCFDCAGVNPCIVCGCINHISVNLDSSTCDYLGFCQICDKFDIREHINASNFSKKLIGPRSRANSLRRFRVGKNS